MWIISVGSKLGAAISICQNNITVCFIVNAICISNENHQIFVELLLIFCLFKSKSVLNLCTMCNNLTQPLVILTLVEWVTKVVQSPFKTFTNSNLEYNERLQNTPVLNL